MDGMFSSGSSFIFLPKSVSGGGVLSSEIEETSKKKRKVVAPLDPFKMTRNGTVEVVRTLFFFLRAYNHLEVVYSPCPLTQNPILKEKGKAREKTMGAKSHMT